MDTEDARTQSRGELFTRLKEVIRWHRKGYTVMQLVELTGLSWSAERAAIDL